MTWIKHTPMQVAVLMCCKMWGSGVILTCVWWFNLQIHFHPFWVWWPEYRSASRMATWSNKINHNWPMEHLHMSYVLLSIPLLFLWFLSKINRGSDVLCMHCTSMPEIISWHPDMYSTFDESKCLECLKPALCEWSWLSYWYLTAGDTNYIQLPSITRLKQNRTAALLQILLP